MESSPVILAQHYVHDLLPDLIKIGGIPIRYYSLAYLLGLLLAWWFLKSLSQKKLIALNPLQISELVVPYALLGILIGGRLGYVCFYGDKEYLLKPWRVLYIWEGGMASHGGILGVVVAMYLFARKYRVPFLHLVDLTALTAPMGLFLGRIANFINAELWGRGPTDVPWAVIFPNSHLAGQPPFPRHPSQIYEAIGEGLILFLVLLALHRQYLPRKGALSAVFGFGYGVARIVCEQFREPDKTNGKDLWEFAHLGITRGQLLTVLVLVVSVALAVHSARERPQQWTPPPLQSSG